eukprot:m.131320 g.131320  ORF g.131320 m.131320 type:complete len:71 (+) comp13073_c1_seq1:2997-3209(+)
MMSRGNSSPPTHTVLNEELDGGKRYSGCVVTNCSKEESTVGSTQVITDALQRSNACNSRDGFILLYGAIK